MWSSLKQARQNVLRLVNSHQRPLNGPPNMDIYLVVMKIWWAIFSSPDPPPLLPSAQLVVVVEVGDESC